MTCRVSRGSIKNYTLLCNRHIMTIDVGNKINAVLNNRIYRIAAIFLLVQIQERLTDVSEVFECRYNFHYNLYYVCQLLCSVLFVQFLFTASFLGLLVQVLHVMCLGHVQARADCQSSACKIVLPFDLQAQLDFNCMPFVQLNIPFVL